MFHWYYMTRKVPNTCYRCFCLSADKQHATKPLIETPENETTTLITRNYQDIFIYRNPLKLQYLVSPSVLCLLYWLWYSRPVSSFRHHPHSVRKTGGTYETHSSFDFRDVSYLQRLDIFLISLWTLLKLLYFSKRPRSCFKNLQISTWDTPQMLLFHPSSDTSFLTFFLHSDYHLLSSLCVLLYEKNLCVFLRFSECYRKTKRPAVLLTQEEMYNK